nr:MAG TPA: YopX protein [Caudoviricetes sp.]
MTPKFRAWLKNDKEIIDVDEIHWFDGELDIIGDYITFVRKADEIELMQSTGLKDKNGKEIFEGDIVDYKGRKAVIKWHGSYASFIYRFVDELNKRSAEWYPLYLAYLKCEVIGNIYENPELLEDCK